MCLGAGGDSRERTPCVGFQTVKLGRSAGLVGLKSDDVYPKNSTIVGYEGRSRLGVRLLTGLPASDQEASSPHGCARYLPIG